MLVSMNWIQDYVDLKNENIEELIRRFTLSTAEVEDVYYKGKDVENVIVGEIVSLENHPDSKKLHLLKIDGGDRLYDCVCGAPNVRLNMKVAFVKAGGRVPGGEIAKCKIAGYDSEGMCCSEAELGISEDHSGILELDTDAANGTDFKSIYPIDDIVFEVDNKSLTNRPDLWGHYGIAREFAALTGKSLKPILQTEPDYTGDTAIPVEIQNTDLVYRYSCIQMDNIRRHVSPLQMKIRLTYCGMRPINFLADVTNYIMLELGQPTHAFDARKIDKIVVKTPQSPFTFQTLDGNDRAIDENTLMIYNNDTPVAIAGVMGGLDSEIVSDTTSVVLEVANFDGVSVRKTSSRLGLRTDASMRYEKILDPELTLIAVKRFIFLVKAADSGAVVASKLTDCYTKHYDTVTLQFDKNYVDRYTGIDIAKEQILNTLTLLGFDAKEENGLFTVTVPSWRATKDVTIKADIIEEITRIYGYDNFEIKTTRSKLKPVRYTVQKSEESQIKDILVQKYLMHEVHSYIWCDGKKYKRLNIDVEDNVRILNIPTPENGTIRNSMLPTLLSFAYDNRGYSDAFSLFESGRVVDGVDENGLCREQRKLGIVLFDKTVSEKELYFKAVGIIRFLCQSLKHVEPSFEKTAAEHNWQHPKNTSCVSVCGTPIGTLCTLHPATLEKLDKSARVVCVEIDLDALSAVKPLDLVFCEPSKFPSIDYDLSLVLKDGVLYSQIEKAWTSLSIQELTSVKLIDLYEADGVKSMALRLSFSAPDRTLSMEEIQGHIDQILANLNTIGIHLKA